MAYQTVVAGTLLATYTYDSQRAPVCAPVGSVPFTAPRHYYVYNAFGAHSSISESFAAGWSSHYRYDGRGGVRYDVAQGLYEVAPQAYNRR